MVPEVVVAQMNGLSSLPRVAAVAMFASRQDMDKLRSESQFICSSYVSPSTECLRLQSPSMFIFACRYVVEELDIASPADKEKWIKTFSLK